jgi:hypothetical protein
MFLVLLANTWAAVTIADNLALTVALSIVPIYYVVDTVLVNAHIVFVTKTPIDRRCPDGC